MTATTTTTTTITTTMITTTTTTNNERTRDNYAELGQGMRMMRDKEMQDEDGGQGRGQRGTTDNEEV